MLNFFNKISGLMIFIVAVILTFAMIHHRHHGRCGHRHAKEGHAARDSVRVYRDSTEKK
jgi:hypothetical protein